MLELLAEVVNGLAAALGIVDGGGPDMSLGWLSAVLAVVFCVGTE